MLKVLVVDDEPPARRALAILIGRHAALTMVGEAGSVEAALDIVAVRRPDVLFLDIELGRASGFGAVERLAVPHVVVVTAHAAHAREAFDVAAVDFLLKPVLPARFAQTVKRLVARAGPGPAPELPPRLALRTHQGRRVVAIADISALKAEGDDTWVLIAGQAPLLVGHLLGQLAHDLPEPTFMRLSRSLIVNLARVTQLQKVSRDLVLVGLDGIEAPLRIGRVAAAALKQGISRRRADVNQLVVAP